MTVPENYFFERSANELIVLNLILTFLLANGLTANQLTILGNFLCSLGQGILTIQGVVDAEPEGSIYSFASDAIYSPENSAADKTANTYSDLQSELAELKAKVKRLEMQLASEKTQHNPNDDTDTDADQCNRQSNE